MTFLMESPSFAFGVLLGALLLCLGLGLGLWLGRRTAALYGGAPLDREQLQGLIQGLFRWTNGFASDVSQQRQVLDQMARELIAEEPSDDDETQRRLAQISHVNECLQERLEKAESALQEQAKEISAYMCEARTDALTELPNRRAFNDEVTRRLNEWRRSGVPFSVVLIDIDHFKRLNDQFGHPAGDTVLAAVARTLRETMRDADMVARIGGEEFAVVLPRGDLVEACQAAERARQAIAQSAFCLEGRSVAVTVSCGAAQTLVNESAAAVLKRADKALYASKAAGRNATYWHDGRRCLGGRPTTPNLALKADPGFTQVCDDLRQRLMEVARTEV